MKQIKAAGPISPSTSAIRHVIKFHAKKAEAECWSGARKESSIRVNMQPEASAKALFEEGFTYSGNVAVDPSVKPFFEALRSLYQCKNASATSAPR